MARQRLTAIEMDRATTVYNLSESFARLSEYGAPGDVLARVLFLLRQTLGVVNPEALLHEALERENVEPIQRKG